MAISHYWTARTLDEIRAAPSAFLRLMAKKCWLTLWNTEIPNNKAFAFLQEEFVWLRLLPARWVVLLMLAPIGIWAATKRGNRDGLFILATYAGLYSAANIIFFICDRYRYPVWPVMAVFAGGGIVAAVEAIRQRRRGQIATIGCSAILMAALSLPNWFHAKLPSFARDLLFRSIACYEKGRFEEALGDINRSIELDPRDATALHHQGNVLFALDRLEEARKSYAQVATLNPEDASVWNNLGTTLDALGRTEDALQAFGRAMEGKPPSRNAFLGTIFIQLRSGQLDQAAATLARLPKLGQAPDPVALATRSILERRRGNSRQAEELEQQARALDAKATDWAFERSTKSPARQ